MGIYVSGMEMPENCCECPVNREVCERGYGYLLAHPELYDKRADDCPLVEISLHGRLIDVDELKKESQYSSFPYENEKIIFESDIDNVPTIIPAEYPVMEYPQVEGITPTVINVAKEGE